MLIRVKNTFPILSLRKFLFEKKFSSHQNVNYFRGVFKDFEEARASAPSTKPIGYDNPVSSQMYKERAKKLHSTDYPVLFWMEKIKSEISRVFDFGGHFGIHYYAYEKLLNFDNIEKWTVCDVEHVCSEGRKIAKKEDDLKKLSFVTDMKLCKDYDLFLANGSIQYLEWELHEKLLELEKLPSYIIINITPLHPTTATITLNNIGTAFCPYYLRKESEFLQGMQSLGYELLDLWENDSKNCFIAFEPERSVSYYRGAIMKKM